MHSAIVLAAGFSQRMGEPKPFLTIHNKSFLEIIISNLKIAGVGEIVLVINPLHKNLLPTIQTNDVIICYNPHPELGQFSSLKIGAEHISKNTDDFFMCLADHPLVNTATYTKMLEVKKDNHPYIILPKYQDRKGHPVLFSNDFLPIITSSPSTYTAKNIIESYANSLILIDVDDKGILIDIDTKDEYDKAIREIN